MPYSLLTIVQHFQEETFGHEGKNFYTEDFYKVEGQTQLHKFMFNPNILEKLLDDYWS